MHIYGEVSKWSRGARSVRARRKKMPGRRHAMERAWFLSVSSGRAAVSSPSCLPAAPWDEDGSQSEQARPPPRLAASAG